MGRLTRKLNELNEQDKLEYNDYSILFNLACELEKTCNKMENATLMEIPCMRQTHNHKGRNVYRIYYLDYNWNSIRYYEYNDETEAEKKLEELKK